MSTDLDRPYAQQPATRAAAIRVVSREPEADMLLAMLGLVEEETPVGAGYEVVKGRMVCTSCSRPVRLDGICRKRQCAESAR